LNKLSSPDELEKLRKSIIKQRDPNKPCVTICGGTGCLALGGERVITAFKQEIKRQRLETKVDVRVTGCPGFL